MRPAALIGCHQNGFPLCCKMHEWLPMELSISKSGTFGKGAYPPCGKNSILYGTVFCTTAGGE